MQWNAYCERCEPFKILSCILIILPLSHSFSLSLSHFVCVFCFWLLRLGEGSIIFILFGNVFLLFLILILGLVNIFCKHRFISLSLLKFAYINFFRKGKKLFSNTLLIFLATVSEVVRQTDGYNRWTSQKVIETFTHPLIWGQPAMGYEWDKYLLHSVHEGIMCWQGEILED